MDRFVHLREGSATATFDVADGFRLVSLVLGGRELLAPDAGRGVFWHGAFVMAPWTSDVPDGRFRFLGEQYELPIDQDAAAIHGVARKEDWIWRDGVAQCRLRTGWPLGGHVRIEPHLTADALSLTMTLTAEDRPMPAAIGWHPWFVRTLEGAPGSVVLPDGVLLQHRDAASRPTGLWRSVEGGLQNRPLNDGLRVGAPVDVVWPSIGRVRVSGDGDYMIVFDDNDHGICVEPMTSPPGIMDRLLAPGEAVTLRLEVRWLDR